MLAALSLYGQGQVNFANAGTGWFTSAINDVGGAGLVATAGAFTVELWAGASAGSLSLVATANPAFTQGFFFTGQSVNVGFTGPGFAQIRVWDNNGGTVTSFDAARNGGFRYGDTLSFAITPTEPPNPAANMINMPSTTLQVIPEPSTIALGVLAAVGALLFRRRK